MLATAVDVRRRHDEPTAPMRRGPTRPGLSRDEEIELAMRVAQGDQQARNRMVQANMGLVNTIAREFRFRGLDLDDLIGEGNLGLIRAAEDFDPRFETRFATYASFWIKQAIRAALINNAATIRLPAHMVGLVTRWRRVERELRRELGRAPSVDEIASSLGLSDDQKTMVSRALEARRLRLECCCGDGILGEMTDQHRVDERIEAEDEWMLTLRRMERLDDRERTVLMLRYGLQGDAQTLRQIGDRLGVTREWARKLTNRALSKLSDEQGDTPAGTRCATVHATPIHSDGAFAASRHLPGVPAQSPGSTIA
jgi:RNA polymerase primary sigma factor